MASKNMTITNQVVKEGLIHKKSNLLKQWRRRFLVLNRETLCVFKKEGDQKKGRTAKERIFLIDIISFEKYSSKKRKFCLCLVADGRNHYFSCASEIDRELWMRAITTAQNQEKELEENDPIRQKSMKLTGGLKRITIERQKGMGLGCTIKNVGGVIFVNRILEQGTVSSSGVLRPGDQLVDINGIELTGRSVAEISEIIRSSPEQVVCTVKPSTDFRVVDTHAAPRTDYAEIDLSSLKPRDESESSESEESDHEDRQPSAENVNGNPETTEDNKSPSQEPVKYEEPQYDDVIPRNLQRRHSSPLRHDSEEANPPGQQKTPEDVQYLELNFPTYDRPRLKSDPPKKPPKNDKKPVAPIAAYAYIELDFKDKQLNEFTKLNVESINEEQKEHSVLPK